MDLFSRLEHYAGLFPDKLALGYVGIDGNLSEELNHITLLTAVQSTSNQLNQICEGRSRVVIILPTETAFIKVFLGSLHAGLIAVPCPIGYSEPAIQRVLNTIKNYGASVIVTNRNPSKCFRNVKRKPRRP